MLFTTMIRRSILCKNSSRPRASYQLITSIFIGATAAAGFHGNLARRTFPAIHAGTRPTSVE